MRFIKFITSALLAAVASAGGVAPTEDIFVSGFSITYTPDGRGVTGYKVNFSGSESGNVYCSYIHPLWPKPDGAEVCNNDVYTFDVHAGSSKTNVLMKVFHQITMEPNVVRWGQVSLPLICDVAAKGQCDLTGAGHNRLTLHLGDPGPNYP